MAFRAEMRPVSGRADAALWGLGCAPIGNLYSDISDECAVATIEAALAGGIRYVDTAPFYGSGASEYRLGLALAGFPRDELLISTKVGRQIVDGAGRAVAPGEIGVDAVRDLSRDGVWRSLEGSLRRLGTDRVDVVFVHDPPDAEEVMDGALPALLELRDQGVIRAVGVGMRHNATVTRLVRAADLDVVMEAGRLTLLDQSAATALLPDTRARGMHVVAAGVLNSGILADPDRMAYFDYAPASPDLVARAHLLSDTCERHGVALRQAAVRYPLRLGADSVVIGARTEAEVEDLLAGLRAEIPSALWAELEAVARS